MSNLLDHAKTELARLRTSTEPDEMQDAMDAHILKMVEVFSEEGHSGFSASYATKILEKLLRFEPITPLQGTDDEWNEVRDGTWQNNRCSHVFKRADGTAYDIQGKVFVESDGCAFTSGDSFVDITFPYVPKTEYVKVEAE